MNNTLIDNSVDYRLVRYIKNMLADLQCKELKIATGYWDLPGTKLIYDELKTFLDRGGKFDLLIGQEPMVRAYQLETISSTEEKFPDFYIQRDVDRFRNDYKDVADLLLKYMNNADEDSAQIRVHVYGQGEHKEFLHAKCYIFLGRGYANGIIGSSNFTQKGLEDNAELNYLETENSVVTAPDNKYSNSKSHLSWFLEKWQNSEPWTGKFIDILGGSIAVPPVPEPDDVIENPKPLTPYEVYIRLLEDAFGMDDSMDAILKEYLKDTIYTAQSYQLDAVKQCYNIMKKMGGFLLADVVGLGKTVVGCLLIRYYLEHCKKNDGSTNHVLIVAPPAIVQGWKDTIAELDKANPSLKMNVYINIISMGKLVTTEEDDDNDDAIDENSALDLENKPGINYGLIMIDESHRFRNSGTLMYDSLDNLINNIRSATGESPYVGLVSATPQNNRPIELKNQIHFFVPYPKKSQFSRISNCDLDAYFTKVSNDFKNIDPLTEADKLVILSNDIRNKILNDIIVRRTRSDIETMYPGTIKFPTTIGPNVFEYIMSHTLARLFNDSVEIIDFDPKTAPSGMSGIRYHRYSAITRFDDKKNTYKKRYEGKGTLTVDKIASQLAKIMKLLLIKRLESSFDAFKESLENLSIATQNMIDMWNDDRIFICPQLDVNHELLNAINRNAAYTILTDKIADLAAKGKNAKGQNAEYKRDDFDSSYITDLIADKAVIDALLTRWKANSEDPKLDEFKAQLPNMMANDIDRANHLITQIKAYAATHPDENEDVDTTIEQTKALIPQLTEDKTKLVIFSEAIATTNKIVDTATALGYRVLKITAANRSKEKLTIQENFDANYDIDNQKDDYDILVTTEVLAEGVNLHRANAILNYDSPWNAARLIQRIGRVNRIGSKSKAIFVYNFFPSANGNKEIQLIENAYRKLQAFHTQFGEDDKVFNPREILSPANFRSTISGPDSWQIKFMKELKDYKDNNAARFAQIMEAEIPLRIAMNATDACNDDAKMAETLCAIQNSSASNKFFVAVDTAGTANGISMQDILEHCQCTPETPAIDLPVNIGDMEQKAMDFYTILLQQRLKPARPSKNVLEAQRILAMVWAADTRFDAVRSELNDARMLVDAGDASMANSIIKINQDIESKQISAVPYTDADIANIIQKKMSTVRRDVEKKFGTNSIFITFNKQ